MHLSPTNSILVTSQVISLRISKLFSDVRPYFNILLFSEHCALGLVVLWPHSGYFMNVLHLNSNYKIILIALLLTATVLFIQVDFS